MIKHTYFGRLVDDALKSASAVMTKSVKKKAKKRTVKDASDYETEEGFEKSSSLVELPPILSSQNSRIEGSNRSAIEMDEIIGEEVFKKTFCFVTQNIL